MLPVRCWRERQTIICGSISSHHHYGKRMLLSFNKKIHIRYYQNMSFSIEGASLEWVDTAGVTHIHYFGHWSDDIISAKQDDIYGASNIVLPCPSS